MAMEELTVNNILYELNSVKHQIDDFKMKITNKNVVACLGNTRKGKSTLINYIRGNELLGVQKSKRFVIETNSAEVVGPYIKHGSLSHTKFPSAWKSTQDSNTVYVDLPGVDDNRGLLQNITNNIFINQLKFANSVKFVVVCNTSDILNDNISEFTKVMNIMESSKVDFDAISLIFTKDTHCLTVAEIASILQEKILDAPFIRVNRNLIAHLVANTQKIGIFRMPSKNGNIGNEIDCGIESAINSSNFIILERWKFAISDSVHGALLTLYDHITSQLDFPAEVNQIERDFRNYLTIDKYVFASTEEELISTREKLTIAEHRIWRERSSLLETVDHLQRSILSLTETSENFTSGLAFLKSMDELLLLDDNIKVRLVEQYKNALADLERRIVKLVEKIENELRDRVEETMQYMVDAVKQNVTKLGAARAALVPTVETVLTTLGCNLEGCSLEMLKVPQVSIGLALVASGAIAGGYLAVYYKTVVLRKNYRKEQGRS